MLMLLERPYSPQLLDRLVLNSSRRFISGYYPASDHPKQHLSQRMSMLPDSSIAGVPLCVMAKFGTSGFSGDGNSRGPLSSRDQQVLSPDPPSFKDNQSPPGGVWLQSPDQNSLYHGVAQPHNLESLEEVCSVETLKHSLPPLSEHNRVSWVHGDSDLCTSRRNYARVLDSPARPSHSTQMRKVFRDARQENFTPLFYAPPRTQQSTLHTPFKNGLQHDVSAISLGTTGTPLHNQRQVSQVTTDSLSPNLSVENSSIGSSGGISIAIQDSAPRRAPWNRKLTDLHTDESPLRKSWRKSEAYQRPLSPPWRRGGISARVPPELLEKTSSRTGVEPQAGSQAQPMQLKTKSMDHLKGQTQHDAPNRRASAANVPGSDCQPSQKSSLGDLPQYHDARQRQTHRLPQETSQSTSEKPSSRAVPADAPHSIAAKYLFQLLHQPQPPPNSFMPQGSPPHLPTSSTWSGDSTFLST
ncbi:hypothetical protein BU16DRAFT_12260 [Lophium mytilinum]|uniref:Uncharacterized protein n=1 Tax=Lophium mytilinum TaxID=390894 RepID=A0A6A6RCF4_9PEZI|nr:hypothetical protein BU16DRAFT_12260 [Lophium mytilinum]